MMSNFDSRGPKGPSRGGSGGGAGRGGPSKGGSGGRSFSSNGPRKSSGKFSDKPAGGGFGGGSGGGYGDRPRSATPSGDRPFRDKPFRERPSFRDDAPRAPRPDYSAPARADYSAPPRPAGGGPYKPELDSRGERKPFRGPEGQYPTRPPRRDFADKPRSGDRPSFGDKPRFGRDDGGSFKPRTSSRNETNYPSRDTRPARPIPVPKGPDEGERIAKVIARAGLASRRDAEALILEGRVSVNGKIIDSPALDITPRDKVVVDGEALPARDRTRLWLYHKPKGLVTTARDPEGRPTVFDAMPEDLPRVVTIGRLDINTEGLLLLTNDGGLARVLELPETGWLRRYRVRAYGEVNQATLDTLKGGVTIDGEHYGAIDATFVREQGANVWLTVDLREGKNREIKRVLEHIGLIVNRLIRVSFGPFQLNDIEEGEAEEVKTRVLKEQLGEALSAQAGADFESDRREAGAPAVRFDGRDEQWGDQRLEYDRPQRGERSDVRSAPADSHREGGKPGRAEAGQRPERHDRELDMIPRRRNSWRDDEADGQSAKRSSGPRRGSDPREERKQRGESDGIIRKRGASITDPTGRSVRVERVTGPEKKTSPRSLQRMTRRETGGSNEGSFRERNFGAGSFNDRPPRGDRPGGDRTYGDRPRGERSFSDRPPRSDRPYGERPQGDRPYGDKPRFDKPRGERSFDKPRGERSFGDKPRGERNSGERSFGDKPKFGDKPRSFGGGKPGGFKGGGGGGYKGGGDRAGGGDRSGGGRFDGGSRGGGSGRGGPPRGRG